MAESDMLSQKNWMWVMRKSVRNESSNETSKIPLSALGILKNSIARHPRLTPQPHLNCKNEQDFSERKINVISIKKCVLKKQSLGKLRRTSW